MTFDTKDWIRRFGAALEDVVDSADVHGVPLRFHTPIRMDRHQEELRRRIPALAAIASEHPFLARQFDEACQWLENFPHGLDVPDGLRDLLLEHPVLAQVWSAGSQDGLHLGNVAGPRHADIASIVAHLAKLSARAGGEHAAARLHGFLVAGQHTRLPAHELTILYGLKLGGPVSLGPGAYLANYNSARRRFRLDEDPDHWLRRGTHGPDTHPGRMTHESSRSVLVRKINWGPAAAPCYCSADDHYPFSKLRYRFPDDHVVDSLVNMFEERDMLLKLLSIAAESKLVSHTALIALPSWMREIDFNLRTDFSGGSRCGLFDVWPDDTTLSSEHVDAFVAAARGWLQFFENTPSKIRLAVDRLVSSYGPAATTFGFAEPIIDVSIALEAMYGPFGNRSITRKLSERAGWLLGGPPTREDAPRSSRRCGSSTKFARRSCTARRPCRTVRRC